MTQEEKNIDLENKIKFLELEIQLLKLQLHQQNPIIVYPREIYPYNPYPFYPIIT